MQLSRSGVRATPSSRQRCVGRPCVALPRRRCVAVRAEKEKSDDPIAGAIKTASGFVDKAADLVPENVPRPAARAGVAVGGVMVMFWLLNKVISGVVTLALLAGVAYYFITKSDGGDDETIDVTPTKGGAKKDMDDPLAEARKIMDKYK